MNFMMDSRVFKLHSGENVLCISEFQNHHRIVREHVNYANVWNDASSIKTCITLYLWLIYVIIFMGIKQNFYVFSADYSILFIYSLSYFILEQTCLFVFFHKPKLHCCLVCLLRNSQIYKRCRREVNMMKQEYEFK